MAGKYDGKRAKTRRPWEFKKKLAAWAALIATATAVASYILAYLDKQSRERCYHHHLYRLHRLSGELCGGIHHRKSQPKPPWS